MNSLNGLHSNIKLELADHERMTILNQDQFDYQWPGLIGLTILAELIFILTMLEKKKWKLKWKRILVY